MSRPSRPAPEPGVLKAIGVLQRAFPGQAMPADTVMLYAEMLSDLPVEAVKAAIGSLIRQRQYPTLPTIGEIRREVAALALGAPSPAEAAEEVREQMGSVGYYGTPRFSHPLIGRAVSAMGWRNLCMSEEPFRSMAEFRRIYEGLLDTWTARVQAQGVRVLEQLGLPSGKGLAALPARSGDGQEVRA